MEASGCLLGIDVGSVTVGSVLMDRDGNILKSTYRVHEGNIEGELLALLREYPLERIEGIATTSSTPGIIRNARYCDSRIASIKAARHFYADVRSLILVGGEKFGLIRFDSQGNYLDHKANTSCAAGTGSFLDQQAKRLNLANMEEFSRIACASSEERPRIASRCAVFAKTDLIHAQQEGYSLGEICDGLSYGLAKNVYDTLFSNHESTGPLVFAGGVSRNRAVCGHLSAMLGQELLVDDYSHLYGALGSALDLLERGPGEKITLPAGITAEDLLIREKKEKQYCYEALTLRLSEYPDFSSREKYVFPSGVSSAEVAVEVDIYEDLPAGQTVPVYLGIDIGSTSTKAVLMNQARQVLVSFYTRTAGRPVEAVQAIFEAAEDIRERKGAVFTVLGAGTTGSGRKFIGKIIGADLVLDEITAHARAAFELDENVDTIIEIGGQDAKFTTIRNGRVTLSIMNNVCAAGTGSFIEEQAKKLGCPLEEYSGRAESARAPLASDRCTVFMERDINQCLNEGYSVDEVLASVLHSVRENYLTKVAVEDNIGERVYFQGATARNRALVAAFEQRLGRPILVSRFCHVTGAMGVALDLCDTGLGDSLFRGFGLYRQHIPIRNEVCELCTNHCKIRLAEVQGETVAFGFLCGRDYEDRKYVNRNLSGFDLLKERARVYGFRKTAGEEGGVTVGLPVALHLVEELPLWKKFFDNLSVKTVTSEGCRHAAREGKQIAGAEFCAPMASLHAHVKYLSERADYIFLPFCLDKKPRERYDRNTRRQFCYYTQYAPSVIAQIEGLARQGQIASSEKGRHLQQIRVRGSKPRVLHLKTTAPFPAEPEPPAGLRAEA